MLELNSCGGFECTPISKKTIITEPSQILQVKIYMVSHSKETYVISRQIGQKCTTEETIEGLKVIWTNFGKKGRMAPSSGERESVEGK